MFKFYCCAFRCEFIMSLPHISFQKYEIFFFLLYINVRSSTQYGHLELYKPIVMGHPKNTNKNSPTVLHHSTIATDGLQEHICDQNYCGHQNISCNLHGDLEKNHMSIVFLLWLLFKTQMFCSKFINSQILISLD